MRHVCSGYCPSLQLCRSSGATLTPEPHLAKLYVVIAVSLAGCPASPFRIFYLSPRPGSHHPAYHIWSGCTSADAHWRRKEHLLSTASPANGWCHRCSKPTHCINEGSGGCPKTKRHHRCLPKFYLVP